MSSQTNYAGNSQEGNYGSGTSWTSDNLAQGAPDGSFTTAAPLHGGSTESLDLFDWGFSISGSVSGIAATYTAKDSLGTNVEFLNVYAIAGSTQGAFTASSLNGAALTASSATYSTGSSSDLCGIASELTPTNVNSSSQGSGLTISAVFKNTSGSFTVSAEVDALACTVYFTPGGGGLFRQSPMNGLGAGGPFFANPIGRTALCLESDDDDAGLSYCMRFKANPLGSLCR